MKPITWIPLLWGVICGAAASGNFHWELSNVLASVSCMVMSGPLLAGYTQTINDYYDRDIDAINEPNRPIPSGAISLTQVKLQIWVLLIGGLAVALALQGTLSNFFAGVNVLTDGNIQVGDYIELADGYGGYVSTIGWRSTRIRTLSDNTVTIPNGRLADTIVTNYNHPTDEMSVFIKMGVGYFENLDNVENVVIEVATQVIETTEGAVSQHAPTVWYEEFGDDNVNFYAVMRAKGYIDSWRVKHSFIKAISTRFRTENIEISFHNTNIFMRDES